jgi:16S rRNA (cytosine967-C5)-methyltransferase
MSARAVALTALDRIDPGGAYANLVVPELLQSAGLAERDRHFVTELVYGTTRMRRAVDLLVDRFLTRELEPTVRNALRLGAYQLHHLGLPPHAAVGETVAVAPRAARGLVNAVLRRVAERPVAWPDDATRLSYPDWVVARLEADLGAPAARDALEVMNRPPPVATRDDGYVQDLASTWVADAVGGRAGERVADLCAAPGGKATRIAAAGAQVVAADRHAGRMGLVVANGRARSVDLLPLVADGARPPLRRGSFDRVLVDAPCTGLGALRRRPDARWRIDEGAPERLAAEQARIVDAAIDLLRPGGVLVYSVCTITDVEGPGMDRRLVDRADLEPLPVPDGPWEPVGRGARLLPQTADTDGMYLLRLRRQG